MAAPPLDSSASARDRVVVLTRRAWLQVVGGAAWVAACGPRQPPGVAPPMRGPLRVRVREQGRTRTVSLSVEEYVRGAILGEASVTTGDASLAPAVFSLQAILARTYAASNRARHASEGFDLCDETHCQVFRRDDAAHPAWRRQAADEAVARTAGRVVVYQDRPIQAVFHALCGGHTRNAGAVWGGSPLPYLRGVPDPFCLNSPGAAWTFRIEGTVLTRLLNARDTTRVGTLAGIVVEGGDAGSPGMVRLDGSTPKRVRGEVVRAAINASQGPMALRSPSFAVRREGAVWIFQGRGNGHGVGVCQIGALARLRAGAAIDDVLTAYYPGTRLDRLR